MRILRKFITNINIYECINKLWTRKTCFKKVARHSEFKKNRTQNERIENSPKLKTTLLIKFPHSLTLERKNFFSPLK